MSQADDVADLLSIGINTGGTSDRNREVIEGLSAFGRLVMREREGFANDGLRMNIVFHVPGTLFQPDYEGVHATRLDRRNGHLLVVSAVPAELTADQVPTYAAEVMYAAAQETRQYLAKRKLSYDLDNLQALIDHLVDRLASHGL